LRDDGPDQRGDDQVRIQRVLGDENQLRQRNRGPVRAGRRGYYGSDPGHGPGLPHRASLPRRRPGLGRLLFPEGHRRADFRRRGIRVRNAHYPGRPRRQRAPAPPRGGKAAGSAEGAAGRTIGVLRLAFKPGTDDIRESAAIEIIRLLTERGAHVKAHDPVAVENARRALADIEVEFVDDPYELAQGCDGLVLATEWDVYRALDLAKLAAS